MDGWEGIGLGNFIITGLTILFGVIIFSYKCYNFNRNQQLLRDVSHSSSGDSIYNQENPQRPSRRSVTHDIHSFKNTIGESPNDRYSIDDIESQNRETLNDFIHHAVDNAINKIIEQNSKNSSNHNSRENHHINSKNSSNHNSRENHHINSKNSRDRKKNKQYNTKHSKTKHSKTKYDPFENTIVLNEGDIEPVDECLDVFFPT